MGEPRGWRAFEVVVAALALTALAPLLTGIAIAIRCEGPGPVIFRQERVGRQGRPFRLWKFRTMAPGAERRGPAVTQADDPRITRVGRFLRRHRLDELPQLINVLSGEMSLVGPRPEVPGYVALYTPEQRRVLEDRPGLTDPATLAFADEEQRLAAADDPETHYREAILPAKLRIYLDYRQRRSWRSDLAVLAHTAAVVLGLRRRRGGAA